MFMQLTREQIIQYLESHHIATAKDLSGVLNVTAANIRHHLKILKQQNLVEEFGKLPPRDRGRPTKLYRLSSTTMDNNLQALSSALFRIFLEDTKSIADLVKMDQIAQKMIGQYKLHPNLFQRLNSAMKWLNTMNYKSRWEASQAGPRMILGYCPYLAIIDSNPEVCDLDKAIISRLIGLPVDQLEKLERSPEGSRHCVFLSNSTSSR
jgi:predicted ArsR family transcriptional regulator